MERYHREWWYVAARRDGTELRPANALGPPTLVHSLQAAVGRMEAVAGLAGRRLLMQHPLDGLFVAVGLAG